MRIRFPPGAPISICSPAKGSPAKGPAINSRAPSFPALDQVFDQSYNHPVNDFEQHLTDAEFQHLMETATKVRFLTPPDGLAQLIAFEQERRCPWCQMEKSRESGLEPLVEWDE